MKRCPQCEFIYEDDQSLCDMDGVLLVFDSRTLPNLHALATVPAVPATAQQPRRNRAVPVFASLVLALVLGMVYYVSTRRPAPVPVNATTISTPATAVTEPAQPPVQEPTPEQQTAPAVAPESKPAETKTPAKKSSTKTTASTSQPKPTPQPKKEENKVNSIIKKTGRILKKPFKF
ncbi:MAG TPA: hypothetical protein VFR78_15400 [Pyrinomonadaceae bacterium]|nr:hypothetical protein [Pyrinomonadaceae bacterium]